MSRLRLFTLAAMLGLSGCTRMMLPDVPTMPGAGKTPLAFGEDRAACLKWSTDQILPSSQAYNARQEAILGSALLLGAASGAAVRDPVTGALAGAVATVPQQQAELAVLQRTYDVYYAQCMYSHGNAVALQ